MNDSSQLMPRRILSFLGLGLGKVKTPKSNAHISQFCPLPDCGAAHSCSDPKPGLLSLLTSSFAFYFTIQSFSDSATTQALLLGTLGMREISQVLVALNEATGNGKLFISYQHLFLPRAVSSYFAVYLLIFYYKYTFVQVSSPAGVGSEGIIHYLIIFWINIILLIILILF